MLFYNIQIFARDFNIQNSICDILLDIFIFINLLYVCLGCIYTGLSCKTEGASPSAF